MLKLDGTGLPNVYLTDGYHEKRFADGVAYSYSDLQGLYVEIARAISTSECLLAPAELRFLRKRLELTQDEIGELLDRRGQTVAKWEKGEIPVPFVEANAIRLMWAKKFSQRDVFTIAGAFLRGPVRRFESEYAFSYSDRGWRRIDPSWSQTSRQVCARAITAARTGASHWSTARVHVTEGQNG